MLRNRALIFLLTLLTGHMAYAQSVSSVAEIDQKKTTSVLMMGSGSLLMLGGSVAVGMGIKDLKMGAEWGGSNVNPTLTNYRSPGRILLGVGVPILAGGIALLAIGIHYRVTLSKKKEVTLNTGCLENGNLGLAVIW